MADWYYAKNGQQQGPVSSGELKRLASSGEIGPADLVFQEGGTAWVEANTVKGLVPPAGVSSKPAPAPAPRRADPEPAPRGRRDVDDLVPIPDEDAPPPPAAAAAPTGGLMDLLMFRVFVAPWLIIIFFWVMTGLELLAGLLGGLAGVVVMTQDPLRGLLILVSLLFAVPLSILLIRILCEVAIIFFRQYDAILEVRKELEKRQV
ncbi:MAG: GYF domain-containing protein [Gemmataceae bacterium]